MHSRIPPASFRQLAGGATIACLLALIEPIDAYGSSVVAAGNLPCRSFEQLGTTALLDYTNPADAESIARIESHHFDANTQSLIRGQTNSNPSGDLDFVLRYVPNHYRALDLMGQWQSKRRKAIGVEPAECYFRRAIAFRENDAKLYLLYGVYLHRAGNLEEAESNYLEADELGGSNAELNYNLGLLMLDKGDVSRAREYANKAYALGYPLPGLRNRLKQASSE